MKNVLYIVAILVAGGSAYWGYSVTQDLEKQKAEAEAVTNAVENAKIEEAQAEKERGEAEIEQKQALEQKALATSEFDNATAAHEKLLADIESTKADFEKAQQGLAEWTDADDINVDEIIDGIKSLTDQIKTKKEESEKLLVENQRIVGLYTPIKEKLDSVTKSNEEYKTALAKNSIEYSVTAVDPKWGFVILNAGEGSMLNPKVPLLVTRNGQRVGLLRISQIEKSQTIADIVPSSLKTGMTIQSGDKVIPVTPRG